MIRKIYIILLNYHGVPDTLECLYSILQSSYQTFQILIVDNSDKKDNLSEVETLKEKFNEKALEFRYSTEKELYNSSIIEKIVLIKASENKGFSAGNNIALRYILKFGEKDSYIWLLNNDTIITADLMERLIIEFKDEKLIYGIPLIDYYDREKIQMYAGKYNYISGNTSHHLENSKIKEFNKKILSFNKRIDYPSGASMIISRKNLMDLGELNEEYFLYFEELDWIFRFRKKGGDVRILNILGVYHKGGSSTSGIKDRAYLLSIKNRIKFAEKFNKSHLPFVYFSILFISAGKQLLYGKINLVFKVYRLVCQSIIN